MQMQLSGIAFLGRFLCDPLVEMNMRVLLAACAFAALTTASASLAEDKPSVAERFGQLAESDPELFQLLNAMIAGSEPEVAGGFDWEVSDAQMSCDEHYDGGFDDCTVEVMIEARSLAGSEDRRDAKLEFDCDVTLRAQDVDGSTRSETGSESLDVRISAGQRRSDSLTVSIDVSSYSPVVNVRISDVQCELDQIS
jgi:hypothetical protein